MQEQMSSKYCQPQKTMGDLVTPWAITQHFDVYYFICPQHAQHSSKNKTITLFTMSLFIVLFNICINTELKDYILTLRKCFRLWLFLSPVTHSSKRILVHQNIKAAIVVLSSEVQVSMINHINTSQLNKGTFLTISSSS